ncbi:MAG: helix-turn-helix transcriptional regulator [Acidobacteria bacterium]|nr:helix-turn-helix transcriptional regulator [Acidobacteriota bacterium]
MRPLLHPAAEDITVEALLHALADPVRVAICTGLSGPGCSLNCSSFRDIRNEPIPKSTLSQHFRILREAGLIRSERRGVEILNSSRFAEVEARFPGLLAAIVNAHRIQLAEKEASSKKRKRAD